MYMQINNDLSIKKNSHSIMNRLKKRHHLDVDMRNRILVLAKCIMCESLKDFISKLGRKNIDAKEHELKLKIHILHQESCKSLYHTWRSKSMQSKDEFLCVICDKMDHAKIAVPKFQATKQIDLWAWTITHYLHWYDSTWSWR